MASIDTLKASDGSGNAAVATVQSVRAPAASTLVVDTVAGINSTFHATMGTPHTFVDPVTSETITVISEATAVDFQGHVDGSNLEIDVIAPGYTDAGSAVDDIVIIKPTTQWADEVAEVLEVSHNDDGSLKKQAVKDALGVTTDPTGGWQTQAYTPSTITNNGNHSTDLTFTGVDLTPTLSEGMRLRTTRTVAAPVQCATFDGTNDYFSKSSPAGMTFTDDFVVSAWVKLSSYSATDMAIVSRYNGTSGFMLRLNASSGAVLMAGYNGGASNNSYIASYQSIPLNKWVHITAQLDMSTFTASTTTSYIMIDGVDVPASVTRGGTNPTALVQAGNLEIGSANTTNFFPGKIAQVAIYSAKVTQATIKASMNQGLTGSETSLVSAYSLSNSLEDLSANNNDLTANGGVLATTADSPFGNSGASTTLEYAIVMSKPVYSGGNTTMTVQTPEGCAIPTSGGISSVDYSSADVPFGFPRDEGKWEILAIYKANTSITIASVNTWYNLGQTQINIPKGQWKGSYSITSLYSGTTGSNQMMTTFSSQNSSEDSDIWRTVQNANSLSQLQATQTKENYINQSSQGSWYALGRGSISAGSLTIGFYGADSPNLIKIRNAYL